MPSNECTLACPEDAPQPDHLSICRTCAAVFTDTPFWNPNALRPGCVAACPAETPAKNDDACMTCD